LSSTAYLDDTPQSSPAIPRPLNPLGD
jgi:hypothetical protein